MTILLAEVRESEASKQAKLKGYVSIGFGRWADKFGNMVAFTTSAGRLAPYVKQEDPEKAPRGAAQQNAPSGFTQPIVEPTAPPQQVNFPGQEQPGGGQQSAEDVAQANKAAADYEAGRYAAEALLELLRQIEAGNITDEGLHFYTSKPFRAYALVMKMAVQQIDLALENLLVKNHAKISKDHGIITYDLKTISEEAKLHPTVAHMGLIDLSTEGPSHKFAKMMMLDHAPSVTKYNRTHRFLTFEYTMEALIRLETQND